MTQEINAIHQVVQERYGAIARSESASCCGAPGDEGGCCDNSSLYNVTLLADLPVEVTGLSLG